MAKDNKKTTELTFTDSRILGEQAEFKKAVSRLTTWVENIGKMTLAEAFSGGREGMPFSALNLGILSLIGQGGIRERWMKACSDKGRENVNIGDFILANICPMTEEERKAQEAREKEAEAIKAAADAWERSIEAVLDCLPDADFINGKKAKITHNSEGSPIEHGEEVFTELLKRAEARAEAEAESK